MSDFDEVPLEDPQLLEEIELLGNLMVMASSAHSSLSQIDIDRALGIAPTSVNIPVQRRGGRKTDPPARG